MKTLYALLALSFTSIPAHADDLFNPGFAANGAVPTCQSASFVPIFSGLYKNKFLEAEISYRNAAKDFEDHIRLLSLSCPLFSDNPNSPVLLDDYNSLQIKIKKDTANMAAAADRMKKISAIFTAKYPHSPCPDSTVRDVKQLDGIEKNEAAKATAAEGICAGAGAPKH